jgi:hypothetical protein
MHHAQEMMNAHKYHETHHTYITNKTAELRLKNTRKKLSKIRMVLRSILEGNITAILDVQGCENMDCIALMDIVK